MPAYSDLHVHLRGTISEAMVAKLGDLHGIPTPERDAAQPDSRLTSFERFLDEYRTRTSCIRTAQDLADVGRAFFELSAADGLSYMEVQLSPQHSEHLGLDFNLELDLLSREIDRIQESHGMIVKVIATAVRHLGPRSAFETAVAVAKAKHPLVVGFGLTGNEMMYRPKEFADAFAVARDVGLGLTAHVGEWTGPDQIIEAISSLNLSRLGHGLSAAKHEEALSCLVSHQVTVEVCIASNLALGRVESAESHPVKDFVSKGVPCALCTDDPAFFFTSVPKEIALARQAGLSETEVDRCLAAGILAAFCDDSTRSALLAVTA
ncbi:adenosine deaminase [Brevundimonas sp.]|uniref:adenosine deaminase n=1 Tax=Brevundimonas sp. TaxID=1871086 RepID=UPI003D1098F0